MNEIEKRRSSSIEDLFNDLEREFFRPFGLLGSINPLFNRYRGIALEEKEKEYTLRIDLPGIEEKDIDVSVNDYTMRINAEHKDDRNERNYHHAFTLPRDVSIDGIVGNYTNGVLEMTLPKIESTSRSVPIGKR